MTGRPRSSIGDHVGKTGVACLSQHYISVLINLGLSSDGLLATLSGRHAVVHSLISVLDLLLHSVQVLLRGVIRDVSLLRTACLRVDELG